MSDHGYHSFHAKSASGSYKERMAPPLGVHLSDQTGLHSLGSTLLPCKSTYNAVQALYNAPQPSLTAHRLYSVSMRRPLPGMPALLVAWPVHDMSCAGPLPDLCCCCCCSKAQHHVTLTLVTALTVAFCAYIACYGSARLAYLQTCQNNTVRWQMQDALLSKGAGYALQNNKNQRAALTAAAVTAL